MRVRTTIVDLPCGAKRPASDEKGIVACCFAVVLLFVLLALLYFRLKEPTPTPCTSCCLPVDRGGGHGGRNTPEASKCIVVFVSDTASRVLFVVVYLHAILGRLGLDGCAKGQAAGGHHDAPRPRYCPGGTKLAQKSKKSWLSLCDTASPARKNPCKDKRTKIPTSLNIFAVCRPTRHLLGLDEIDGDTASLSGFLLPGT